MNTISSYAHDVDTPDDATKIWLAEYFDVSFDYLMGLDRHSAPSQLFPLGAYRKSPFRPQFGESRREKKTAIPSLPAYKYRLHAWWGLLRQ